MTLASKTGQVTFRQKGDRGMMPYPAGEYSSTVTYVATANTAPYVLLSGTYYVMNKVGSWLGTSTGKTPAQDSADYGNNATWIPFENYKAIYVELLMANFGKIASAVFSGEFMFSQQGKNAAGAATSDYSKFGTSAFTPNLMLDFLRGKIKCDDVDLRGKITATDGSFTGKIVANSGKIGGFNIEGDTLSSGTMFLNTQNIYFSRDAISAGIGINTAPSILGLNIPLWIIHDANNLSSRPDTCIAASFKAAGALDKFNNFAISMVGCISGFGVRVRQINNFDNRFQIDQECFISCYNTSPIDIYLPNNPTVGRMVMVKRINNAITTVMRNTGQPRIYNDTAKDSSQLTRGGEQHFYVYDGQYWMQSWIVPFNI